MNKSKIVFGKIHLEIKKANEIGTEAGSSSTTVATTSSSSNTSTDDAASGRHFIYVFSIFLALFYKYFVYLYINGYQIYTSIPR
jgi:hypothetical protein